MSIIFDHDEDDDDDDYMKPHIEHTVMPLPNAEDKKKKEELVFCCCSIERRSQKTPHFTCVCVCLLKGKKGGSVA